MPTVRAVCLKCSREFIKDAHYMSRKSAKHTGCIECTRSSMKKSVIIGGNKFCTKCHQFKPLAEFHNDRGRSDGKFCWCGVCANAYTVPRKKLHRQNRDSPFLRTARRYRDRVNFGDTELFDRLMLKQSSKCAICHRVYSDEVVPRFCIDHCHETRMVRGVLCGNCNKLLGHAFDRVDVLMAAIQYLRENAQIPITGGEYGKPDGCRV